MKTLANDKIEFVQMMISVFEMAENIVEKGEKAVYKHFLLFNNIFQRPPLESV